MFVLRVSHKMDLKLHKFLLLIESTAQTQNNTNSNHDVLTGVFLMPNKPQTKIHVIEINFGFKLQTYLLQVIAFVIKR